MAKRSGISNEDARQSSRRRFLDAGVALTAEEAPLQPFAAIRLRRLCERAGLSSGAFFVHWPDLPSFFEALADELLTISTEDLRRITADLRTVDEPGAPAAGPDDVLRDLARVAEADLDSLVRNELWDVSQLLAVTWGRERLRQQAAGAYLVVDTVTAEVYGDLLRRHGREPRPPLTMADIAVMLQGLVEGIGMRARVGLREQVRLADGDEPMSVFAAAAVAVLVAYTRRTGEAGDAADARTQLTRQLAL